MLLERRQPSGGAGGPHLRGQTMVEFIILIAALSVLALVLAGILGFLPKNILGTQIEQSKVYWSSQAAPIKINDWSMLTVNRTLPTLTVLSNLSLVLSNPTTQVIVVHAVRISPGNFSQIYLSDGSWAGPADSLSITLHPGEQKTVVVQHWASGPDAFIPPESYQLMLSFEYTMAFAATSIQAGMVPVVGGNRYIIGDPGTDCPPPLVLCGQACGPADLCCGQTACTPGKFCCGNTTCCKAGSQLCLNGTCVPAEGCTPPNFKCGSACCDQTEMCNASTSTCQACPPSTPLACGTTCCAEGQYCDRITSTCMPSCDPPDFTCPSGEFYCCNGTQFHFCDPITGACPESCIPPDTTCGPDENGTSYCCNQTQVCNATTKLCQDISCSEPGQVLCNSTDGSRSTCCPTTSGIFCANLTGTCCDTSIPTLPPTILCDYTNSTGSFSACCDGLNCSNTIGCCVAAGNPCNESMGMFCCDGSSCPASGICECNAEAPCCMNQEGGWCNSTDPNIELSCCAASGLLCNLASNSCYLNSSTPCVGEGTPYRALNNSWSCCYPNNQTYGTGYFDPPFPEERQICCVAGSSICGSGADSVCCPSGSCSTDGVCCSANTTNAACGTGYLYTECCAAGLNCTSGAPYDACCNPATTLDVCNDPTSGMTCCGEICKDGPVAGLASYESVCCVAPDNAAVCDGPECCSAACIQKGLDKICCPGANNGSNSQFVCLDNSCCNHTCNDIVGWPNTVDYTCCAAVTDQVCSDGLCCNTTAGKNCVDQNGLQTGTTKCCDVGTVSCGGACCALGENCSAEGAAKQCCPLGTDLWGGECCSSTDGSQKTVNGAHVCCEVSQGKVLDDAGTCCYNETSTPYGGVGIKIYDKCPSGTGRLCCSTPFAAQNATCGNTTAVCCPNPPTECSGTECTGWACCGDTTGGYCYTDPPSCCLSTEKCMGTGNQRCCPLDTTDFCENPAGILVCCGPSNNGKAVGKDNDPAPQSADSKICCPASENPVSFCTGDNGGLGACCDHDCTIDTQDGKGYCCPAGSTICNLLTGGRGCCTSPDNQTAPIDGSLTNKMCCPSDKKTAYCSRNGTSGCCANACSSLTLGSTAYYACCAGNDKLACSGNPTVGSCAEGDLTCCGNAISSADFSIPTSNGNPIPPVNVPNECCPTGNNEVCVKPNGNYECCGAGGTTTCKFAQYFTGQNSSVCCGSNEQACNGGCCEAGKLCIAPSGTTCCAAQNVGNKTDGTPWSCCVAGQTPMNSDSSSGACCTDAGNFVCSTSNRSVQNCCPDSYGGYPVGCNTATAECVYYSSPPPTCPAGFGCVGGICIYVCPNGQTYYDGSC